MFCSHQTLLTHCHMWLNHSIMHHIFLFTLHFCNGKNICENNLFNVKQSLKITIEWASYTCPSSNIWNKGYMIYKMYKMDDGSRYNNLQVCQWLQFIQHYKMEDNYMIHIYNDATVWAMGRERWAEKDNAFQL